MSIMTDQLARHTVEYYRCSRCWGDLIKRWVIGSDGLPEKTEEGEQLAEVKCRECKDDLGFVSQYFVDQERSKDFDWAYEVKRNLKIMGVVDG